MIYRAYIAECEWCPEKQIFPFATIQKFRGKKSYERYVKESLNSWGWVKFENRDFCCESCKTYFMTKED